MADDLTQAIKWLRDMADRLEGGSLTLVYSEMQNTDDYAELMVKATPVETK